MVITSPPGLGDGRRQAIQVSGEQEPLAFRILHGPPDASEEAAWREFLGKPRASVKVPSLVWHLSKSRYAKHAVRGEARMNGVQKPPEVGW